MNRNLNIAFLMDPLETLDLKGDTTFALALEAQRRKHNISFFKPEDLILKSSGLPADNISRLRFAWNHPDCQHMALAQDRSNEKNKVVVPLRNRDFN